MRFRSTSCAGLALLLAVTPAFALHHRHTAAISGHRHGHHAKAVAAHWTPGQRGIDGDRTRAIQTALISRNYMTGQATGDWDPETEAAMQKFQGDNGWQTRLMPDSRALIKLGLGPDGDDGTAIASSGSNSTALQPATGADTLASIHSIQN
jgi:peptidoglycan hydrolase-like protein with peptidoglycan-binding domain